MDCCTLIVQKKILPEEQVKIPDVKKTDVLEDFIDDITKKFNEVMGWLSTITQEYF